MAYFPIKSGTLNCPNIINFVSTFMVYQIYATKWRSSVHHGSFLQKVGPFPAICLDLKDRPWNGTIPAEMDRV